MSKSDANIVEIFSSIQGEGVYVGQRQIFVRFHGCTLKCRYCDTNATHMAAVDDFCRVESSPGRGKFSSIRNPVSLSDLSGIVEGWEGMPGVCHHSLSLTGGEPLLHSDVLSQWIPHLSKFMPLYLETNGILHGELSKCVEHLKYISMDVKLPSVSGIDGLWDDHQRFLRIAARSNVFVKAVVSNDTTCDEIQQTCDLIKSVDNMIPLVLQPLSADVMNRSMPSSLLMSFHEVASCLLDSVRIIPQIHSVLGFL